MPQGGMILNPSAWPTPQLFIIHQRSDSMGPNAVPFGML